MFTDKVTAADVPKMDSEYQDLLRRVLAIQADCEIGGPHLYVADILLNAPTASDKLIVARTAAEEIDHYRKIAKIAGHIGLDVSYVLEWPNQKRYVEAFRGQISSWEDYAVFGFLIDRVGGYQLDEFTGCSFQPLDEILPQVLTEEAGHIAHGTNTTAELAQRDEESHRCIQQAVNFWYPTALDMFGLSHSRRSERYMYWGLKRRTNEQARQEYIAEVTPLIETMGLEVPETESARHFV
jgi:ring-1,2-phenylacetyl-CoA epoxidase subunit PaaA